MICIWELVLLQILGDLFESKKLWDERVWICWDWDWVTEFHAFGLTIGKRLVTSDHDEWMPSKLSYFFLWGTFSLRPEVLLNNSFFFSREWSTRRDVKALCRCLCGTSRENSCLRLRLQRYSARWLWVRVDGSSRVVHLERDLVLVLGCFRFSHWLALAEIFIALVWNRRDKLFSMLVSQSAVGLEFVLAVVGLVWWGQSWARYPCRLKIIS